jgi:hypothetical protein
MITFYTIPRAFVGEFDRLQRRAIRSWQAVVPDVQVVLYGNETGVSEVAQEYGCHHSAFIARNGYGTPLLNDAMNQAALFAKHDWLCEISTDILLHADFLDAFLAVQKVRNPFVVGQRWDVEHVGDINTPRLNGKLHPPCGVDYFLYKRSTLGEIPPFAVGRTVYDQWLVWHAMKQGLTVIDATEAITAVHMKHGYPAWENGKLGLFESEERTENQRLAALTGMRRLLGIQDAPFVLESDGTLRSRK